MTTAGPMKTYGRTPSRERAGQQVDEPVHRPEQREDAADADDERDTDDEEPVGIGVAQEVERRRQTTNPTPTNDRERDQDACSSTTTGSAAGRSVSAAAATSVASARLLRHLGHCATSLRTGPRGATAARPLPGPRPATAADYCGQLASTSASTPSRLSGPPFMYSTIAGPEAAAPDLGRHQVGCVEPPGARP